MLKQNSVVQPHENGGRVNLHWRIGIVFIAVTLVWLCIRTFVDTQLGEEYSRSSHIIRAVLTSLVIIPLIVAARRFLDRRSWDGLKLTSLRSGWRPLLIGVICWLLPAAIGLVVCIALGWTEINSQEPVGNVLALGAGLLLLVFIYEALPEELIFRGYFYRNLVTEMPRWLAVLTQALLFVLWGLLNGGPISPERSALFFVAALIIGIFRVVTDSVWASIGFHLAFQTISQLFGTIGGQFTISDPQILSLFALGVLPFAMSLSILKMFYKTTPEWQEREPDSTQHPHEVKS
jgi:membrane protease YdiL (CAAX protease family)